MSEGGGIKISLALGKELDKAAADLLIKALGPFADELGGFAGDGMGIMRDRMAIWRRDNLRRALARSAERCAADGLSAEAARALPMSEAVPLLRAISEVDDDALQELWAGLLASAMNPQSEWSAGRSFIFALNSMDGPDAALLNLVVSQQAAIEQLRSFAVKELGAAQRSVKAGAGNPLADAYAKIEDEKLRIWAPLSEPPHVLQSKEIMETSRQNLIRLGVLESAPSESSKFDTPKYISVRDELRGTMQRIAIPASGRPHLTIQPNNPFQNLLTPVGVIRLQPTAWGRRFVQACKLAPSSNGAEA